MSGMGDTGPLLTPPPGDSAEAEECAARLSSVPARLPPEAVTGRGCSAAAAAAPAAEAAATADMEGVLAPMPLT